MHRLLFALFGGLVANAQVRVLSPSSLQKAFEEGGELAAPNGVIPASTATFGTPHYGESFVGRLLKIESDSCTFDYAKELEKYNITERAIHRQTNALRDIFLIERGNCSFVKKVAVAQEAGADAVIITDFPQSEWDRRQITQVILADDGNGQRVNIPSVLVEKNDGARLAAADYSSPPLVAMEWSLPQKSLVRADFWTSSGSVEATRFLASMAPLVDNLKGVVDFQTHYYILRLPEDADTESVAQMCYKGDPNLCVAPADAGTTASPQDVMQENLLQLCLADLTATRLKTTDGQDEVQFSPIWWKYITKSPTACPLRTADQSGTAKFGRDCSRKLLAEVGASVADVEKCITERGDVLLKREQNNNAWAVSALRVNGARFSGNLEAALVLQAVCSAFEKAPPQCTDAAKVVQPDAPKILTHNPSNGHVILVCAAMIVCLLIGMYLWQMYSKNMQRRALRHEVMLEVKTQLQDYYRVEDPQALWGETGGTGGSNSKGARETEFTKLKFRV